MSAITLLLLCKELDIKPWASGDVTLAMPLILLRLTQQSIKRDLKRPQESPMLRF